jgi:hypothetical protein
MVWSSGKERSLCWLWLMISFSYGLIWSLVSK